MQNKILIGSDMGSYSVTDSTRNITISGLPYTLETEHLAYVFNVTQDELLHAPAENLNTATVSGGVITYGSALPALSSGDVLHIQVYVPMLAYDPNLDSQLNYVINQNYEHYTSVEHLIDESDLGLDGTHDGGDAATDFEDSGETYTAANVAEGYEIYNTTDGSSATIDSGGAGNPAAGDIAHDALAGGTDDDWDDGDVASIPEVKRFIISVESYEKFKVHYKITAGTNNKCFLKVYETLNEDADDSDDTDWVDVSDDVLTGLSGFSSDHIETTTGTTDEDIVEIDSSASLKFMVKIVSECSDGTQSNAFDVYIKKAY